MHISELRIRNFRSIEDLRVQLDRLTVFCGPNSCGKSNVFRAIQLAFQSNASVSDAQENLPAGRLVAGGPLLSIWVDCRFENASTEIRALAEVPSGPIMYSFRLTRSGGLTRKLGAKVLTDEEFERLLRHFFPMYVPPIRDLGAEGFTPFKRLLRAALHRAKGPASVKEVGKMASTLIEKRAASLLARQTEKAGRILGVSDFRLDTSQLDIESIFENVGLNVVSDDGVMPLSSLGTGHQSAVIMHLYRQLGEEMPGEVLYLFEEPDNHLHPSTVRSICDDLRAISQSSQVLVSTHSPIFVAHVGFQPLRPLFRASGNGTTQRSITLSTHFSEKQARALLESYGIRLTEPLLCNRVVVVEGATDKSVLSALFELRHGFSVDQAGILLMAAGGKEKVVTLCHLMTCLGVEWTCLMDNDAAYSSEVPYSKDGLAAADTADGIQSIDRLVPLLDAKSKRGKNAVKSLAAIRAELSGGRPAPVAYDGSPIKSLVEKTKSLNTSEQALLKAALAHNKKRESKQLLRKVRAFVWSKDLEQALLNGVDGEERVEAALKSVGELSGALPAGPARRAALANRLHEMGNVPHVLVAVVQELEKIGHFNRSEVNECFRFLFPAAS